MANNKNEIEWIYELKVAHKAQLNLVEVKLKNSELKNTHLALELKELNDKMQELRNYNKEIEHGFVKMKRKYEEERFMNENANIEDEYFTTIKK